MSSRLNGRKVIPLLAMIIAMSIGGCRRPSMVEWTLDASEPLSLEREYDTDADTEVEDVMSTSESDSEVVSASPPSAMEEPEPVQVNTYTVQRGDTLWSIAERTYGDGKRWRDIVTANAGLDPTKLRVGQKIILP